MVPVCIRLIEDLTQRAENEKQLKRKSVPKNAFRERGGTEFESFYSKLRIIVNALKAKNRLRAHDLDRHKR